MTLAQLADVGLRRVEQHTLPELRGPGHLHLDAELTTPVVTATDVHDTVLAQRVLGNQLRREILHALYLLARLQGQQSVQETTNQVRMLAEHPLERQIRFRVQISFHSLLFE